MASVRQRAEGRTPGQIREHYDVEKALASRLRQASKEERRHLYASLYDELYRRVPHHPQLNRKFADDAGVEALSQMRFLQRFLSAGSTFLEVGPGDCALSVAVAQFVKKVYAVDVSEEITRRSVSPPNLELTLSDGSSIPVPFGAIDVAYSNQLMEHLHPDDATEQLANIYRALANGGWYICLTPNRLLGPHDISKYFDAVASGFHLKEYTNMELYGLFKQAGFATVQSYVGIRGTYLRIPLSFLRLSEGVLSRLPRTLQQRVAWSLPARKLLGIRLVARKQARTQSRAPGWQRPVIAP